MIDLNEFTMEKFKSKLGLILASIYLIITLIIVLYSFNCSGMYCGLMVILPIMNWIFLEGLFSDSMITYILLVILNTIILYLLGLLITAILKKMTYSQNKSS